MKLFFIIIILSAAVAYISYTREFGFELDGDALLAMLCGAIIGILIGLITVLVVMACSKSELTPYEITDQYELHELLPDIRKTG